MRVRRLVVLAREVDDEATDAEDDMTSLVAFELVFVVAVNMV